MQDTLPVQPHRHSGRDITRHFAQGGNGTENGSDVRGSLEEARQHPDW